MPEKATTREDSSCARGPANLVEQGTEPAGPFLSRTRIFLLFFVLTAMLYFQTLGCPFLWDEYRIILGNAAAGAFHWESLPDLFVQHYFYLPNSLENDLLPVDLPYYRPVTVLFHGLSYRAFGPFFPAYRLESLFLHIANGLLLFSLFSTLFRRNPTPRKDEAVALAGATLFLVHPRNVETVSIIANQTGLLCTFLSLLSVVLWARILTGARRPLLLYWLSLPALLLAMLSKETAYAVPMVHGLLFFLLGRRDKKSLILLSGYFLLPGILLAVRQAFVRGPSIAEALAAQLSRHGSEAGYVASVLGLLLHQLSAWLVPLDIQLFQYPFSVDNLSTGQLLLPFLALLVMGWRLRGQKALLVFGFGWFLVFYLPSSNLIPIGTLPGGGLKAAAHHLYPAHAGLCLLLVASILLPVKDRASPIHARRLGRMQWFALTLLILLLGSQAFRFAAYYRRADLFYEVLLERYPLYTGAWTNYGWHKLYVDKDPEGSEWILLGALQAIEDHPCHAARMDLMNNLMVLYLGNNRPLEAETMLQCIMDPWVVKPKGNILFWHIVQWKDKISGNLAEKSPEDPEEGP